MGFGDILILAVIALVFVGPKRLPEAGRKIGEFYRQLREAADTVKNTVTQDIEETGQTHKEKPPAGGNASHHGTD
ncbi:MAG: Sec-independent protein translocase protein TatB [Kiloniellales bacterium]|nr:Sec-independent protein translocase protein TatB [Kiloniellales bacterium]